MADDLNFTTKVSGSTKRGHEVRGHLLTDLVNEADFVAAFFLSLAGHMPTNPEKKVFNAILVAALDHGLQPASGFVPRVVAASGNDVHVAMASTLLALGPRHGGAITQCMSILTEITSRGGDLEKTCQDYVAEMKKTKTRIAGFGHAHYKVEDPRTTQLYQIAQAAGLDNTFINVTQMLAFALEESSGRTLVINVDGAIAALLLSLGFDPLAGNAVFALARVAGSIAHIIEEKKENKTVRRLTSEQVTYTP